ncbi:hypothetical protein HOV23_gp076 [Pseudomonas phage Lana]|uniref:Glyoxalase-related protein domain-containing protein n=1 Tax=Pseudomonas phage Lana TaxID=2530172 RepID=A0A481W6J4_9CAUD|nr:hypothetical protein HOV23_gp076 [Pseudomonas phage Lana]QBJ04497.1 hypothetical protein [Pseudomonas phage Lana]
MTEQPRSLARVKKIAQNLRRAARDQGEKLPYQKSLEQAAQQCGFPTYNHAVIALPESDPTPVPRS